MKPWFIPRLWFGAKVDKAWPAPTVRLTADQTRHLAVIFCELAYDPMTRADLALVLEKKWPDYAHSVFYDVFGPRTLSRESWRDSGFAGVA